ncbi:MAG: serine/threonine-protein kinase [Acidobacteriota bacterium]|nr:serine/threonine-protein kinase [Acidobacteriota bacterium]
MTAIRDWERVRAVFHGALDTPADGRRAFLDAACAGDDRTRREVESLLAAEAQAGAFLETPAHRLEMADSTAPAAVLSPGDRIGDFEVVGALGSGGMGEVYRARDVRLRREVALKLLPRAFASDPQRLTRFERESRMLAALNHPHIAAIHSIEQVDGMHVLVLELVEGPTLADRLASGALPVAEALQVARELAAALAAAHERGIIHRDLKPANIKAASGSGLKLLDFGLAKERAWLETAGGAPGDVAPDATIDGLILGTCAYMSPEQARGRPVDRRTDIWAFGCVLFEMLTGTRAFAGETLSDTIVAVLEREPDWTMLPPATPEPIVRLLRRCLEKDAQRRLHDAADARIEIDDAQQGVLGEEKRAAPRRRPWRAALVLAFAASLVASGYWLGSIVTTKPASRVTRFTWSLPAGMVLDAAPAVSPDGRFIAFTARPTAGAAPRLFLKALHEPDVRAVVGTEGAKHPFWSPDSRALGYFASRKLMKVAVDGGAPVPICNAQDGRGGTWSAGGMIVFGPDVYRAGLSRVAASGGTPEPATLLDETRGENSHRWPVFLPDGIHFLYFVRALSSERRGVYVARIDRAAAMPDTPLFQSDSDAVYAPLDRGGALLSVADGQLHLRPFDARRLRLTGDPRTMELPAGGNTPYHAVMASASADVLAHVATPIAFGQRLASSGRDGEGLAVDNERDTQNWVRVSPDGRRLAWQRLDPVRGNPSLWVEDLTRGTRLRATPDGVLAAMPVWSPDGSRLAYATGSLLHPVVTTSPADGTGAAVALPCPPGRCFPSDWSRDGRWVLATVYTPTAADVWLLDAGGGRPHPLLTQSFAERDARFSPDGRYVAYVSEETGRAEIAVQRVDGEPQRDVISVSGGTQPVWSRDGTELFFVDPGGLLRSSRVGRDAHGRPSFAASVLLNVQPIGAGHFGTQYDVSLDGRRIYFFDRRIEPPPSELRVIVGWRGLVKD